MLAPSLGHTTEWLVSKVYLLSLLATICFKKKFSVVRNNITGCLSNLRLSSA
uniref:Uncharacterized protein n=1 Tax=Anguilla anguilla TaxID=7936 RepID=A0A0E9RAL7_ANGAN